MPARQSTSSNEGILSIRSGIAWRPRQRQFVGVAGVVWEDGDGLRQTGEAGLGATVEVLDAAGPVVRLGSSGIIDGSYLFEDLAPGTYSVRVLPWASAGLACR